MYESPGLWVLILGGTSIPLWVVLLVLVALIVLLGVARHVVRKRRNRP